MPTYQYRCEFCRHEFEEFQSMKADPLITCPSCGKDGLKRLIGAGGGMIFKGSGFYLTDYKGSSASAKSSTTETKSTAKPAESKPDSPKPGPSPSDSNTKAAS